VDEFFTNNQIFLFIASIIAAVVWLRQGITKSSINETTNLATTRGEIIDDLHADMDQRDTKWQEKCEAMMTELLELRGQMTLMQELKTTEIIDGVKAGVAEILALEIHKLKDDS
jgi:hypothetical protein